MSEKAEKFRLDKWLWQARFVKSRSLAAGLVTGGHVRVNSERASKPAYGVQVGDVLTFSVAEQVRVVRILAPATRRGPASEAQTLYDDLSPAPEPKTHKIAAREEGNARPTKRDRRQMERLRASRTKDALE